MYRIIRYLIPLILLATTGCAKFDLRKNIPWGESSFEPPVKLSAIWTDTVLQSTNATPMRGFGGRLLFYDGDGKEPIKVEGMLVVYAFDETNRDPANPVPDRSLCSRPINSNSITARTRRGTRTVFGFPGTKPGATPSRSPCLPASRPKRDRRSPVSKSNRSCPAKRRSSPTPKSKPRTTNPRSAADWQPHLAAACNKPASISRSRAESRRTRPKRCKPPRSRSRIGLDNIRPLRTCPASKTCEPQSTAEHKCRRPCRKQDQPGRRSRNIHSSNSN